jgi:hypothetical protein
MPRPHGKQASSWWSTTTPATFVALAAITWIGTTANFTSSGRLAGVRVWNPSGDPQPRIGLIWDATTLKCLRSVVFRQDVTIAVDTWLQAWFRPWFRVDTTHGYRVAILMGGGFRRNNAALVSPVTANGIQLLNSFQSTSVSPADASITTNTNANGVDFLFQAD